jgi:hypothetical protein
MILRENIIWFGIKTLLTLLFCFPLLFYVLDLLFPGGNKFPVVFIYFIIYETLNLLFFLGNIKIIIFVISCIDSILIILSLVLFIYCILIFDSDGRSLGYWIVFYPTVVAIFYYGFFGIVIDKLYGGRFIKDKQNLS